MPKAPRPESSASTRVDSDLMSAAAWLRSAKAILTSPIPDLASKLTVDDQRINPPVCTAGNPSICRKRVDKRGLGGLRGWYIVRGHQLMSYKHIRYEKADRLGRIILNRPRYKNAQS